MAKANEPPKSKRTALIEAQAALIEEQLKAAHEADSYLDGENAALFMATLRDFHERTVPGSPLDLAFSGVLSGMSGLKAMLNNVVNPPVLPAIAPIVVTEPPLPPVAPAS